jgi:hypothetical protein
MHVLFDVSATRHRFLWRRHSLCPCGPAFECSHLQTPDSCSSSHISCYDCAVQKKNSIQSSDELVVGRESEAGLEPSSLGASLNFAFRVERFISRIVHKSIVACCLLTVATLALENLLVGAPICRGSG